MSFTLLNPSPTNKWSMWQCCPLFAEFVTLKIVDALLTLTLITSQRPWYTHYLYAMNCILIIDIQHWVSEYHNLHPGALLHLNFWSTSIHIFWVRNDMALSHSCAFGRQYTACRSFPQFLVNIAGLPHLSSSSIFSLISMMYHNQFQLSQPCAQGQCGELCRWMHRWMQHNGRHSDRFVLGMNRSSHNSFSITHLNLVCIFGHKFSCCFLTSQ